MSSEPIPEFKIPSDLFGPTDRILKLIAAAREALSASLVHFEKISQEFNSYIKPFAESFEAQAQSADHFIERIKSRYPRTWNTRFSDLKDDPELILTELRKRTRAVADKRDVPDKRGVPWQYYGVRIVEEIVNEKRQLKLWDPELHDIPEEKFKDVTSNIFDFSQMPGEILSLLEGAPYLVWNRVDTERQRLKRQDVSKEESREMLDDEGDEDIDVFDDTLHNHALEAENLFSGQEQALDRLEMHRLLEEHRSKFTDMQWAVMWRRYLDNKEWKYAAIAKDLGINDKTVREHEKAALKKLRPYYVVCYPN